MTPKLSQKSSQFKDALLLLEHEPVGNQLRQESDDDASECDASARLGTPCPARCPPWQSLAHLLPHTLPFTEASLNSAVGRQLPKVRSMRSTSAGLGLDAACNVPEPHRCGETQS